MARRLDEIATLRIIHRCKISACAEMSASAGEDRDSCRRVGLELLERLAPCDRGRAVDGVAPVGPLDRDDEDAVCCSPPYAFVGHCVRSCLRDLATFCRARALARTSVVAGKSGSVRL